MRSCIRSLGVGSVLAIALLLTACPGGSGGGTDGLDETPGAGVIELLAFSPNPIVGCGSTPFTITGTGFETVTGTTALVTFRALNGATPFAGGTTDRATVTALVTSDTTIEGMSPQALICGVPSVDVEVDVRLESGVFATSTGTFTVVILAPTITSILPNPIPAAIPTAFTITGTGFGPVGGPVTVRFSGDAGALLFDDGTHNFEDVIGSIVSTTTITGVTPIATVCDALSIGASIQLFFTDGCCTLPTTPGFVTFIPPNVTSVLPNPVPAAIQTALTVNGKLFGPTGTVATVRFIADGNFPLFSDGTKNTIDVPAVIATATTLTLQSPLANVCGVASRSAALRVISPFGSSCRQTAAGFITFNAPTLASVAPNPIPGAIQTPLTLTGTNFGPTGSAVVVRFTADLGRDIFNDGTSHEIDVTGVITGPATVTLLSPLATICNLASAGTQITVFAPSGGACAISPVGFLTFLAPTLASFAPTPVLAASPTAFTITGTGFGTPGSPVTVTFISDTGAAIFGNATLTSIDVPGVVASPATITGTTPLASLCPLLSAAASVRVTLQNGSCVLSAPAFMAFDGPTVASVAPNPVPAAIPTLVTITGTGFFPTGGTAPVTFITDGAPAIFGDGTLLQTTVLGTITGATTITVTTPHATVTGPGPRTATLRIALPSGSCATSAAGVITFNAPTLASITTPLQAAIPTAFTITGANFGPVGSEAVVRFIADGGATPFGNGDMNSVEVPGVVATSATITGVAPQAALCPALTLGAAVRIQLQDGSNVQSAAAFVSFAAPTITSIAFVPTPWASGIASTFTITGTNFGPVGSLPKIVFTAAAGATPFGNLTQNEAEVTGLVVNATTITGQTPIAIVCGPAAVNVNFRVTMQGGSCAAAPAAVIIAAPTAGAGAFAPVTAPALAPTPFTITGSGFSPIGGQAIVVFTATVGTPFNNGSSAETTVTGTITGPLTITGTTPLVGACPANVVANVGVRLPGNPCVTPLAAGTVTFLAPTITSIANPAVGFGTPTPTTITGTNFAAAGGPFGQQVFIRWTSATALFADGTANTFDSIGTVTAATTITTTIPAGTLCGVVSATATFRVTFAPGACADSGATIVTFNAPQLAAAPGGFAPQNLNMDAPTAFTITGINFAPVGGMVDVRFRAPTPVFNGGTTDTAVVQGLIVNATTITGASPVPSSVPNVINPCNAVVFFEDGSCTNQVTFAYFRASGLLAVNGTSNTYLIDTATNVIAFTIPIPGQATGDGGVAIDRPHNRVYVVNSTTGVARIIDLAAGTVAGTPVPALTSTSIALAVGATGAAYDSAHGRVYVINPAADTLVYISTATNQVGSVDITTWVGVPTRILADASNDRVVVGITFPDLIAVNTNTNQVASLILPPAIATAAFTGGFALDIGGGRAYYTYNDPNVANADQVRAVNLLDLQTTVWTTALAAGSDPNLVLGVDGTASKLTIHRSGPNDLEGFDTWDGVSNGTIAVAGPSYIRSANVVDRMYVSRPGANEVVVITGVVPSIFTTIAGVVGASSEDGMGP